MDFDLGNNFNSFDNFEENDQKILIWTKKVRRTVNTYMYGWNVTDIKEHHSNLKKKWGCNGSLKKNEVFGRTYDKSGEVDEASGKNVKEEVFHLSKDCVDELVAYLLENGVEEDNIEIKSI